MIMGVFTVATLSRFDEFSELENRVELWDIFKRKTFKMLRISRTFKV